MLHQLSYLNTNVFRIIQCILVHNIRTRISKTRRRSCYKFEMYILWQKRSILTASKDDSKYWNNNSRQCILNSTIPKTPEIVSFIGIVGYFAVNSRVMYYLCSDPMKYDFFMRLYFVLRKQRCTLQRVLKSIHVEDLNSWHANV